jgi:hypothetical protein
MRGGNSPLAAAAVLPATSRNDASHHQADRSAIPSDDGAAVIQRLRIPPLRLGWLILAMLVIASSAVCFIKGARLSVGGGDTPAYLNAAYHLSHDHTFSEAASSLPAPAAIGREPGYAVLLAVLMTVDPAFGRYTPDCLTRSDGCDPRIYRAVGWANVILIMLAGVTMYLVGLRVCGNVWAALVAAGYLLFNFQMNAGWADPASDRLAVLLVSLTLLATAAALQRGRLWRWCGVGAALAALTLVKAVFLPFFLLVASVAAIWAALRRASRPRILPALTAAALIYGVVIGGWSLRNWDVDGQFRVTDSRSGTSLSTREVFNHMTGRQYAAAFVFWTRGFGEGLARRLFPPEVTERFDLYRPGGFYDDGQNRYPRRVAATMASRGVGYWPAVSIVDRQLMLDILERPLTHFAVTLPLFYRGIWIDEFVVLGLPLFVWMLFRAVRRRDVGLVLLLSIGAFNLLFYAAFSLNIPRYQMTAVPVVALAAALATTLAVEQRHSARRSQQP